MSTLNFFMSQQNPIIGNWSHNLKLIKQAWLEGKEQGADVVVTGELSICGYPPEDMLLRSDFIEKSKQALDDLINHCQDGPAVIVGLPWQTELGLWNGAAVIENGQLTALAGKRELPNYGVFDEKRYFTPCDDVCVVPIKDVNVGIAICEDMWQDRVAKSLAAKGADVIVSMNASPYEMKKDKRRLTTMTKRSQETGLSVLYLNMWGGQDEILFDGGSLTLNAGDNEPSNSLPSFCNNNVMIPYTDGKFKSVTKAPKQDLLDELYQALVVGLRDYVQKSGFDKGVVLGLSGGIDSALCATIAADAVGPEKVLGVLMPSPHSSDHSVADALALGKNLGIKTHTIAIEDGMAAYNQMLAPLFEGLDQDVTEENIQARIRGGLLMAISNKFGKMVLTTGNKSEMAVGYATLYGDMCGGYNPLKDVYKTKVFALAEHVNKNGERIPQNTISKPPSAELRPNQLDNDSLPDYDVLDGILKRYIERNDSADAIIARGYSKQEVLKTIGLVRAAEYKRRQAAPGTKIGERAFGKDFRFPIVNHDSSEVTH